MIPKILVIENKSDLRDSLIISLIVEGYEVMGAADGVIGINLARRMIPDVIICDFPLDGEAAYGQLRDDQCTQKIPCILMSADALPERLTPKPNTFLRKPFGRHDLMEAVLQAIAPLITPPQVLAAG
ncbi:response regulator receiver domain protein [[Synechococcus] sp. NIES-970]|uniref:response regulator n=1 Tax=Picosynechococcus sp. NKBG15041c TaxID=1407650 RepID=UPI0004205FD7|nr:response regulator [Picosynechococcus sp. NKBG15041c]BAW96387.1 response regulator receiver domain protein [[Synechococcus] sp. NIES-970]